MSTSSQSRLAELLPQLQSLSRADKVRAIQLLAEDLGREDSGNLLEAGRSYPIWSPYDAHEAAASLLEFLKTEENQP